MGVYSGALIADITTPTGLVWRLAIRSISLYILVLLTGFQGWYTRRLLLYERETMRFLDNDYCVAYLRSICLPELALRAQERIRVGQGGEFKQAMDEIKQVLGLP